MNAREKVLVCAVGGLLGLGVMGLGVHRLVVKPVQEMDKKTIALRDKLEKAKADRRAFFAAEEQVNAFARRTFSDSDDKASAASGEMLTRTILQAGLQETDFSRSPVGPRKLRGAREIGWSVNGQGRLQQIINLLFLLNSEPHLSRVDGLVVSTGEKQGAVHVRFKYLTLTLDPAPLDIKPTNLVTKYTLDSTERRLLDTIASRDLLRPYIKRPPQPEVAVVRGGPPAPAVGAVPSGPETLKVVSLSEWQGEPEVHVRDLVRMQTTIHRPGDTLAGGSVVMIDYRALPLPGRDGLKSFSRVIVKIGEDFWAIERGSTLDQKYKLDVALLPERLAALKNQK
jgi:hypothetical protein